MNQNWQILQKQKSSFPYKNEYVNNQITHTMWIYLLLWNYAVWKDLLSIPHNSWITECLRNMHSVIKILLQNGFFRTSWADIIPQFPQVHKYSCKPWHIPEKKCHQIKSEKANQSPVNRTNDNQCKQCVIKPVCIHFFSLLLQIVCTQKKFLFV